MEIAQRTYMSEAGDFRYDAQRAEKLQKVLIELFEALREVAI